jgi:hypothetical protein
MNQSAISGRSAAPDVRVRHAPAVVSDSSAEGRLQVTSFYDSHSPGGTVIAITSRGLEH